MLGGALGGKMLGGGGGGGRLLKSISVPASAFGLGLVAGTVVVPAVGVGVNVRAGAMVGTGEDERGGVGLEGETGADGLASGLGIMDPGKTGDAGERGEGGRFPAEVTCWRVGIPGEGVELVTVAGSWGTNLGTGGMRLGWLGLGARVGALGGEGELRPEGAGGDELVGP